MSVGQNHVGEDEEPHRGWLIDLARDRDRWKQRAIAWREELERLQERNALVLVIVGVLFFGGGFLVGIIAETGGQ